MKKINKLLVLALCLIFVVACGKKEENKLENIVLKIDKKIAVGEEQKIEVIFDPSDMKEKITWSTSDEKIATIDNGVLKTLTPGEVEIYATTTSGFKKKKTINVYQPVEEIKVNQNNVELFVGDKFSLEIIVLPENATDKEVTITIDDNSILDINDDAVITAKESGKATITISNEEGVKTKCNVVVKNKPIEYSGTGDKIIKNISIPSGSYKMSLTNKGTSNFIVKFYEDDTEEYGDLLVNEIGQYSGTVILKEGETEKITNGILEIKSSGKWTVKIEQINNTSNYPISGKGDTVTGMFEGTGKRQFVKLTNKGSSNFIVKVYDEYGNYDLLANEIGKYNGEVSFSTVSGRKYYFVIISNGDWSISW